MDELTGTTQEQMAVDLSIIEDSLQYGQSARVTLCTEFLPTQDELELVYASMLAEGHHVSQPVAGFIEGVPTTQFTIRKGSPVFLAILPLLVPILTLSLIAYGITQIQSISNALIPILGIVVLGVAIIAIAGAKPATAYVERGGKVPYLPSAKKKVPTFVPSTIPADKLLPALKPFDPYKFAQYVLLNNQFTEDEIYYYSGKSGLNPHNVLDEVWQKVISDLGGEFVKAGDLYILTSGGVESPPNMKPPPSSPPGASEPLLPHTELQDKVRELWRKACEWEKIPADSRVATFSEDNPFAKEHDEAVEKLIRYNQIRSGLQPKTEPAYVYDIKDSKIWGRVIERSEKKVVIEDEDHKRYELKPERAHPAYLTIFRDGAIVAAHNYFEEYRSKVKRGEHAAKAQVITEKDGYQYHPSTADQVQQDLEKSILEEGKAVRDYQSRGKVAASAGDSKTSELYQHIAGEEDKHQREFQKRVGELVKGDNFVSDSQEYVAFTIEDIGYRDKIDQAFQTAIARAKR